MREMAEEAVLGFLEKNEEISDSGQFAADRGIDHQELTNIIKRLSGFRFVDAQVSASLTVVFSNTYLHTFV